MKILNFRDFLLESSSDLYAVGAKGEAVKKIQRKLIELGLLKIDEPTGNYQELTKTAVEKFQSSKGLTGNDVDGIVGPVTWNLLFGTQFIPSTALDADKTRVERDTPSLAKSPEEGAKKLVGDTNATNPNASLLFDGLSVKWLIDGKPVKEWKAVSGLTLGNVKSIASGYLDKLKDTTKLLYFAGKMKMGMKQAEASKVDELGPTPPGKYKIEKLETRSGAPLDMGPVKAWWNWFTGGYGKESGKFTDDSTWSKIAWGNYRSPLIPYPGTNTFGRDGFYIHGGSIPGSHGCIDLGNDMDDFAKYYTAWQASTGKGSIDLTVNYSEYDKSGIFTKFWQYVQNDAAELQNLPKSPGQNVPPSGSSDAAMTA